VIGYEWTVYAASSHEPIVACGITPEPAKATKLVELVLRDVDRAAWGMLLKVTVAAEPIRHGPLNTWPPTGQIQVCRRDRKGNLIWKALDSIPPDGSESQ
jgi:hypothetical protein